MIEHSDIFNLLCWFDGSFIEICRLGFVLLCIRVGSTLDRRGGCNIVMLF